MSLPWDLVLELLTLELQKIPRTSYFGAPKNPWNHKKISGGSSGGSATTIASRDVPFALGSDTGGSIRQPASYTGIVGMKPTYGRISRYGLIALKIAVPNYFMSDIVSDEIKNKIKEIIELLKSSGAEVDYIDIKYIENAVTLYQIIAMGEASSNLARFDGIRYGHSTENPKNIDDLYLDTRKEGFGEEVKRRIMVGSYLLSGENAKIYYDKALSIRDDIRKEFLNCFKKYDLIIGPTTTTTAYELTDPMDDPSKSFMDDVLVIPVNMAGLPGLNLPVGFDKDNMPIGMQIIGNSFDEARIYQLASFLEKKLNLKLDPNRGEEDD